MVQVIRGHLSDIPRIMNLAKRMVLEGTYADVPFNDEHFTLFLEILMATDNFMAFLAESSDGELVGFLLGDLCPHIFSNELKAVDLGFYVTPEYRGTKCAIKMLKCYEDWALGMGIKQKRIYLGASNGYEKSHDFFIKMGYDFIGGAYQKAEG